MINGMEVGKGLLVLKIICFAMFVSLAIYLFVGLQVAIDIQVFIDEDAFVILRPVLYAVAFVTLIITRYIKKFFLSAKGRQEQTTQNYQQAILQKYTVAVIASLALSESIGIYGFILFIIGKNSMDLYLLILVSAVAIFLNRPRMDELNSLS